MIGRCVDTRRERLKGDESLPYFSVRERIWKMGWNWFCNTENVWRWRIEGTSRLALSSMEKENNFSFSLHLMSLQRWIQYTFVIEAADCVLKLRLFFASSSPFPFFLPFRLIFFFFFQLIFFFSDLSSFFCPFLLKSQAAFYLKPSFILSIFAGLRQAISALSEPSHSRIFASGSNFFTPFSVELENPRVQMCLSNFLRKRLCQPK